MSTRAPFPLFIGVEFGGAGGWLQPREQCHPLQGWRRTHSHCPARIDWKQLKQQHTNCNFFNVPTLSRVEESPELPNFVSWMSSLPLAWAKGLDGSCGSGERRSWRCSVQASSLKAQVFAWRESISASPLRWSLQRRDRTEGVCAISGFRKHLGPGKKAGVCLLTNARLLND